MSAADIPDSGKITALDDTFSIRGFVASVREVDIRKCWPFSTKLLQTCMSQGKVPLLPPLYTDSNIGQPNNVPADDENREEKKESGKVAQHSLLALDLDMNKPSSTGIMASSCMPWLDHSSAATEGPNGRAKESKGELESVDDMALFQGGLPHSHPESQQHKDMLVAPRSKETVTMFPEKQAPSTDAFSFSISNVDALVQDLNVAHTRLETTSRDEQENGFRLEPIELHPEAQKVAQNEREFGKSSSDAGLELFASKEPFSDPTKCTISPAFQSPTIMAMNAASHCLPKKEKQSMTEATYTVPMHRGKKRKVRTKLQQNVAMQDEFSHLDYEEMIPQRIQPLAGDNCNELPNNKELKIDNAKKPACLLVTCNMNGLLMMSSLKNLPATGAQGKRQGEISNRVQDIFLPGNGNTLRHLMPLSSLQDPDQQVHTSGNLHASAYTGAHGVKSKSDIFSLSELNKSSGSEDGLTQDSTRKRAVKQIRSESLDLIRLTESILKKPMLSSYKIMHPNPALVSGKGIQFGPSAFQHGPVINHATMESVEAQVMEKNSEQVFLNEGKKSYRPGLDTALNAVQHAVRFSNMTRIGFQYPSSFISNKQIPQDRENHATMESVEAQVMEKNSEQVFLNEGKKSYRPGSDTAVNAVQHAVPFSNMTQIGFQYPSSFISDKQIPQDRDILLNPGCNNRTHLYAQVGNPGKSETSVWHGFSESNIMLNRPENSSVLRLMGSTVVVNPDKNTLHNPQTKGPSRIERQEDESQSNFQQCHGVQHCPMFWQGDVSNTNNHTMVSSGNENFAGFAPPAANSSSFMLRRKQPVTANCRMQLEFQEKTALAPNLTGCPSSFSGFSVPDSSSSCPCTSCKALKLPQCNVQAYRCINANNSTSARIRYLSRQSQNFLLKTPSFNSKKQEGHNTDDRVLRHNSELETASLNLMESSARLCSDYLAQPPETRISKSTTAFATPNPTMSQVYTYSVGAETSRSISSNIFSSTHCLDSIISTISDSIALQHHKQHRTKEAVYCTGTGVGFQHNEKNKGDRLSQEFYSGYEYFNQIWGESIGTVKDSATVMCHETEKKHQELIAPLWSNKSAGTFDGKLESCQPKFSGRVSNENIISGVCRTNMNPAEVSAYYQDDGALFRDFHVSESSFPSWDSTKSSALELSQAEGSH